MWIILNQEHTKLVVNDHKIIKYFTDAYSPDENYFVYLLNSLGKVNEAEVVKEQTTFVNWDEPVKHSDGQQSPKEYMIINPIDMNSFNQPSILFARKFHENSDIGKYLKWNKEGKIKEEAAAADEWDEIDSRENVEL